MKQETESARDIVLVQFFLLIIYMILETLNVDDTELTQQQTVAILTTVSEGSKMATLYIRGNDLSGVDSGLLTRAVIKLKTLHV